MRTAVLICGKCPKDYKNYRNSIYDTLIKPYESDVFISTWTDNTYDPSELWSLYKPKRLLIGSMDSIKQKIENFNEFAKQNDVHNIPLSMYPLYYKLYTVNQLRIQYEKESNVKYDLIIRTRFDLNFSEKMESDTIQPFVFDKISDNEIRDVIESDILYLRMDPFFGNRVIENWVWDSFSFGNDRVMNVYCDSFLNLERIISSKRENVNINEKILYYNLVDNGVQMKHTHTTYRISTYQ